MRPRGVPSSRVKITPWYYTGRSQTSRRAELEDALKYEENANSESPAFCASSQNAGDFHYC